MPRSSATAAGAGTLATSVNSDDRWKPCAAASASSGAVAAVRRGSQVPVWSHTSQPSQLADEDATALPGHGQALGLELLDGSPDGALSSAELFDQSANGRE